MLLQILPGPDPPKGRTGRRQGNVGPAVPPIEMGGRDRVAMSLLATGPPCPLRGCGRRGTVPAPPPP